MLLPVCLLMLPFACCLVSARPHGTAASILDFTNPDADESKVADEHLVTSEEYESTHLTVRTKKMMCVPVICAYQPMRDRFIWPASCVQVIVRCISIRIGLTCKLCASNSLAASAYTRAYTRPQCSPYACGVLCCTRRVWSGLSHCCIWSVFCLAGLRCVLASNRRTAYLMKA